MTETLLDRDGQPVDIRVNYRRNVEKAMFGLRGILSGIVADQKLKPEEVLYLTAWCRSQSYLEKDGDFIDLMDLMYDVLRDGVITRSEMDDLKSFIHDTLHYKYRRIAPPGYEARINELLGFVSGLAADNIINEAEVLALTSWLRANEEVLDEWPANILKRRIEITLADGLVSEEEKDDLLQTIRGITGASYEETGLAYGMAMQSFEDTVERFNFAGSVLCISGAFICGSRAQIEKRCTDLGATIALNVSKKVHALIVGSLASRDWRFSSHGRKIEAALKLRLKGSGIIIMSEQTWLSLI